MPREGRKSLWHLVLLPVAFGGWLASWYGLFVPVWAFHVMLYPDHQLRDFWRENIAFASFVPSFVMVFALAPGAVCLGFALANCIGWLVVPLRRIFDAESAGQRGASFRESTAALLKVAAWALSIGLVLALVAASLLASLR